MSCDFVFATSARNAFIRTRITSKTGAPDFKLAHVLFIIEECVFHVGTDDLSLRLYDGVYRVAKWRDWTVLLTMAFLVVNVFQGEFLGFVVSIRIE